jgi:hypothetical protein
MRAGRPVTMLKGSRPESVLAEMTRLLAAARAMLRSIAYAAVPEARGKRDLRIDLLRGFCVFVMTVDHVGGESSWLYVLTGGNHFYVSAAEGFVLLSGIAMGMVHASTIDRDGARVMFGKVLARARFLYVLTVALTISFAAVSAALGTPWATAATPAQDELSFALAVATFHRSYSLTDVLVLYTLLVVAAAPILWLMSRRATPIVLALSVGFWGLAQISLDLVPRAWPIVDGGFPFSAWQVLFVMGLAIGFHRRRIAAYLEPRRLVALGVAAVVALVVVNAIATHFVSGWIGIDARELLFDKNDTRIGRVLALLATASFAYAAVTVAWVPIRNWTGWLLVTMGQRSLFAYGVQLFAVAFWSSGLMAPVRVNRENALFQASAVLMVWLACRLQPIAAQQLARMRYAGSPRLATAS